MYDELLKNFPEITCDNTTYEFPVLVVKSPLANAKISLYGGHVISFTPAGEKPVLWQSGKSNYTIGKAIRGGVPVCWPWFGPAADSSLPAHGFARISLWQLVRVKRLTAGALAITLRLDEKSVAANFNAQPFVLELTVTIAATLELQLAATNTAAETQTFQAALHSYFVVGDAAKVTISKLAGLHYFDKVLNCETDISKNCDTLEIDREIDRVYLPSAGTIAVADNEWRRTLTVEKSGSFSTIIWNPWIAKSKAMADFGDNEYMRMLCIECGNVFDDARTLEPGETTVMTQKISVEKWD